MSDIWKCKYCGVEYKLIDNHIIVVPEFIIDPLGIAAIQSGTEYKRMDARKTDYLKCYNPACTWFMDVRGLHEAKHMS